MNLTKVMLATLVAGSMVATAHAGVVGTSSNEAKVKVGAVGEAINPVSDGDTSHDKDVVGSTGIAVISDAKVTTVNKYVELSKLREKAESNLNRVFTNIGGQDSAGVVQLDFNKWGLPSPIPDHKPLGKFSYQELEISGDAGQNVYFGEWHQGSNTSGADADRTVWYVGQADSNYSVPTSGSATYNVTGINQYNGSVNGLWAGWTGNGITAAADNLLTGTLKADFGKRVLSGKLDRTVAGGTDVTNTLAIRASIASNGSFANDKGAVANGGVRGKVQGQFYGNDAAALAGIATFDNTAYDTAFGGTKQ